MAGYDFDSSASLSALGSVASTALNVAANGNIGSKNRKFYREERLATQEYNTAERLAAQQYNYERWLEATKREEAMYNKYSSPAALKRQYLEAGLNPLLAADNNSVGNVSSSSQAAPSHPQSSTPIQAGGAAIPYFDMSGISEGFVNVATALKGIAEARQAGVNTDRVEALLDKELESWDLSNKQKELVYNIDLSTLGPKKMLELKTALSQLRLTDKSIEEKEKIIQGLAKDNIIKQNEVDTWREMFEVNKANKEADTAVKTSEQGFNEANSKFALERIKTEQTQQELNKVTSYLRSAEIPLTKAMENNTIADTKLLQSQRWVNAWISKLKHLEYNVRRANSDAEIKAAREEYETLLLEYKKNQNHITTVYGKEADNGIPTWVDYTFSTLGRALGGTGAALILKKGK